MAARARSRSPPGKEHWIGALSGVAAALRSSTSSAGDVKTNGHAAKKRPLDAVAGTTEQTELEDAAKRSAISSPYVIFDLDGTLIDFESPSHIGLGRGLKGAGLEESVMTWELHASIIGMAPKLWAQKVLDKLGVTPDVLTAEQYVEEYNKVLAGLYHDIPAMKGAIELIRRLKALGIKMAIATSSQGHCFDLKMKYHPEILNSMDAIVVGDDPAVKRGKPAPDIFLEAARRLGAAPEDCTVFEDSPHGIRAGYDAGMYTVAIPDSRLPGNDFSLASHVVADLDEWTEKLPVPTDAADAKVSE